MDGIVRSIAGKRDKVVVVGAGVGGLSAALRLIGAGAEVLVLEAAGAPGGKIRQVEIDGRRLDAGPTVLTMRWAFEELFRTVGADLDRHIPMTPLHVLARHAWDGSSGNGTLGDRRDGTLDLFADEAETTDAIGAFAGAAEARRYTAFCAESRKFYETLEGPFLKGGKPTVASVTKEVGLRRLPDLLALRPMATLWQALGGHFKDPRLRQLFGRYATYSGSSPFQAPATLMLIAHVERKGVWQVDGGMITIAKGLAHLIEDLGGTVRTNAPVARIETKGNRTTGVTLADGEFIEADSVIFNGDVAALADGLLGDGVRRAAPGTERSRRSLSALAWQMVATVEGFPLSRHTVFFGPDYPAEFKALFGGRLPSAPTVYVCAQDRADEANPNWGDPNLVDPNLVDPNLVDPNLVDPNRGEPDRGDPNRGGPERLHLHVNAPPTGDYAPPSREDLDRCEDETFRLMARCGLHLQDIRGETVRTGPAEFERLFPATGGALYGPTTHGWKASFARASPRTRIKGLYLTGGSVHPGAGVPMACLSGQLAAGMWMADRASIRA
ncbi:MAG: FAD-dependent oxidoreductase [Alphaproteobacteria bacterium]|nr:FAD-dependent oxidoreductase [Alphaproteobacteria bacterium]